MPNITRSPVNTRSNNRVPLVPPPRAALRAPGDVTPLPTPPRPNTAPPRNSPTGHNVGGLPVAQSMSQPGDSSTRVRGLSRSPSVGPPRTPSARGNNDKEEEEDPNKTMMHELDYHLPSFQEAFRLLSQVVLQGQTQSAPVPSTFTSTTPAFRTPEMKKPDTFDGSSASRLRTYLQQCKLIFLNNPSMFSLDVRKTVYASSYLTGKAFEWVQPYLANMNDDPEFLMNSWDAYEGQLNTLFGDPNKLRNTENELDSLYMRDSDHALSYIASFRSLESRLSGWSDRALMHSFRKGLPSQIFDLLDQQPGEISTLAGLVNATLKIDIRHQERVRERRRDNNL